MKTSKGKLSIGFYLNMRRHSELGNGMIMGDELYADRCASVLRTMGHDAEVFALNSLPAKKLDVMLYLNGTAPEKSWATAHVLYLQNPYAEGSEKMLKKLWRYGYDGYMFISKPLTDLHRKTGRSGTYLPFAADTSMYFPHTATSRFACDVSFVGNNFKGDDRALRYLLPATEFNFRLYGKNWGEQYFRTFPGINTKVANRLRVWTRSHKGSSPLSRDMEKLYFVYGGRLPIPDLPILYSSSKIVLNFTHEDNVRWQVTTLRIFEALACGTCVISDYVSPFDGDLNKYVILTDGGRDGENKIRYYLEHPIERMKLAEKGSEYVRENHSLTRRMSDLLLYIDSIL